MAMMFDNWWHQAWMLAWELLYSQQKRKPSGGDEKSGEFSQMVQVLNSSSSFCLFILFIACFIHVHVQVFPKELGSRNYNGH